MRKILIFIAILFSIAGYSQIKQPTTQYGFIWKRGQLDSAAKMPMVIVGIKNNNGGLDTAQFRYDKTDSSVKVFTGSQWKIVGSGLGIRAVYAGYGLLNVNDSTLKVDTSLIATLYDVSLKLNISDTTNKWVQDYYVRSDSLFKYKNGTESFLQRFYPYNSNPLGYVTTRDRFGYEDVTQAESRAFDGDGYTFNLTDLGDWNLETRIGKGIYMSGSTYIDNVVPGDSTGTFGDQTFEMFGGYIGNPHMRMDWIRSSGSSGFRIDTIPTTATNATMYSSLSNNDTSGNWIKVNPYFIKIKSPKLLIDLLPNLTTQDELIGITNSTDEVGRVTIGPGLSLASGVLSSTITANTDSLFGVQDNLATQNRIFNASGYQFQLDSVGIFKIQSKYTGTDRYSHIGNKNLTLGVDIYSQFDGNDFAGAYVNNTNGGSNVFFDANNATGYSSQQILPDSIIFNQSSGNYSIYALPQRTDTTANKVMTWNSSTKKMGWGNWFGGGGGSQTLQQVFNTQTGGSVLTKDDSILLSGNQLKIYGTSPNYYLFAPTSVGFYNEAGDGNNFSSFNLTSSGIQAIKSVNIGGNSSILNLLEYVHLKAENTNGPESYINIKPDSISFNAEAGNYSIYALPQRTDTTTDKVMTWNSSTKKMGWGNWFGGGGGSQTLEQVLTTGNSTYKNFTRRNNINQDVIVFGTGLDSSNVGVLQVYNRTGNPTNPDFVHIQPAQIEISGDDINGTLRFRNNTGTKNIEIISPDTATWGGTDLYQLRLPYRSGSVTDTFATKEYARSVGGGGGYTNLTQFVAQTAWRNIYIDGSGDVQEQAFGTAGKVWTSNGVSAAPTWEAAGAGDMILASAQTNSGIKTFLDGTMKLRNVANTFDGYFVNTNTADRIYTLQNAAGTLAFLSDITGTNSGTNTGDQSLANTSDATSHTVTLTGGTSVQFVEGSNITLTTTGTGGNGIITIASTAGGGTTWNAITDATGNQALTFQVGEISTWTDQNTTADLFTVNNATSTTNSLFSFNRTSTALAAGNNIAEFISSGANGTSAITATGIRSQVTNTNVTSGTNVAIEANASGATTRNYAVHVTAGKFALNTSNDASWMELSSIGAGVTLQIANTDGNVYNINPGYAGAHTRITTSFNSVYHSAALKVAGYGFAVMDGGETFNVFEVSPTTGIIVKEQAAPATPATDFVRIYPKTDGLWYGKDDAGVETMLSNGSSGITIGTTTITSGTNTRVLYNNSGIVGEMTTSGTGTQLALTNTPTLTTPVFTGLPTGTGVASAATASTLVARDANANVTANNWLGGYTTTATAAGTTTLTVSSSYLQYFTGSTTQTVTLPVVSTLTLGHQFIIVNNSTGNVTVNSSGGNAVIVLAGSTWVNVTAIATTGTDATVWDKNYMGVFVTSGKKIIWNNTMTMAGTDGNTYTFPSTSQNVVGETSTQTLTNKRITARTGTVASSATPTINTDNVDLFTITAQTVDITSMTTNLSGTPNAGDQIRLQITGTASRAIAWGASFGNGAVALPTTTSGTTTLFILLERVGSLWLCMAAG